MSIKRIKLVLCIFIPFLIFFLMSHNTFAIENFSVYWRSYQISNQSVVNQAGYNQSGTIVKLLDYVSNETRLLKGFSADFAVSDDTNYTYKTLSVVLDMWQPAATGNTFTSNVPYLFAFGSSTGTKSTTTGCSFNNGVNAGGVPNPNHAVWTCKIDWSDGGVVSNAQLIIGTIRDATSDSPNVAFTMSAGNSSNSPANADVYAYSLSYTLSGSNDPSLDYLVDISSGINETNSLIQEQIENDNQNTQDIIRSNQKCRNSKNLINPDTVSSNYRLTTLGTLFQESGFTTSDFIEIEPNTAYTLSTGTVSSPYFGSICQYDSSKNFVGSRIDVGISIPSKTFISDSNAKYVRISEQSYVFGRSLQFELGSNPSAYEAYGEEFCKNINEEYYDEQRQADENISNQSPSDIDGATNQQTTNLIGIISSFVSALTSINTNGSCQLTLPFPALIGGSQVVNPCNGADKAPTIVSVASSLLLITIFVPLAFLLIKMIYNEIRSFTNG